MKENNKWLRVGRSCLVVFLILFIPYLFFREEEKVEPKFKFLFYTQNEVSNSYNHYVLVEGDYADYGYKSLDKVACKHYDTCHFSQPIESITFVGLNKSKAYYLAKEEDGSDRIKKNTLVSFIYDYKNFNKKIEECPTIDSFIVKKFRGIVDFAK